MLQSGAFHSRARGMALGITSANLGEIYGSSRRLQARSSKSIWAEEHVIHRPQLHQSLDAVHAGKPVHPRSQAKPSIQANHPFKQTIHSSKPSIQADTHTRDVSQYCGRTLRRAGGRRRSGRRVHRPGVPQQTPTGQGLTSAETFWPFTHCGASTSVTPCDPETPEGQGLRVDAQRRMDGDGGLCLPLKRGWPDPAMST